MWQSVRDHGSVVVVVGIRRRRRPPPLRQPRLMHVPTVVCSLGTKSRSSSSSRSMSQFDFTDHGPIGDVTFVQEYRRLGIVRGRQTTGSGGGGHGNVTIVR